MVGQPALNSRVVLSFQNTNSATDSRGHDGGGGLATLLVSNDNNNYSPCTTHIIISLGEMISTMFSRLMKDYELLTNLVETITQIENRVTDSKRQLLFLIRWTFELKCLGRLTLNSQ